MGSISDLLSAMTVSKVLEEVEKYVDLVFSGILAICGVLLIIFAVYMGFKLAKAEDEGKRKESRNQLIWSIIGLISVMAIAALITSFFNGMLKEIGEPKNDGGDGVGGVVNAVKYNVKLVTVSILKIAASGATIFALYVGWQLMNAGDEGKRKQAKMQIVYTALGLIAILVLIEVAAIVLK